MNGNIQIVFIKLSGNVQQEGRDSSLWIRVGLSYGIEELQ